ncbi:MAG: LysE family transporter [Ferroplasma sp.]
MPLPYIFMQGLLIGFSIAAPVGPIGILCIQRTIRYGKITGITSGLGAATADAFYGAAAAFGLAVVSGVLLSDHIWIQMFGGIALCYFGLRTVRRPFVSYVSAVNKNHLKWNYLSTLALTLTNPMTILLFVAVFASIGFASSSDPVYTSAFIIAGVFSGSMLWWLALSTFISTIRTKLSNNVMEWIGRIAGMAIFGFGVTAAAMSLIEVAGYIL